MTGGLGGLGVKVARWLGEGGAGCIVHGQPTCTFEVGDTGLDPMTSTV